MLSRYDLATLKNEMAHITPERARELLDLIEPLIREGKDTPPKGPIYPDPETIGGHTLTPLQTGILERVRAGDHYPTIARAFGVTRQTVSYIAIHYGGIRRRGDWTIQP